MSKKLYSFLLDICRSQHFRLVLQFIKINIMKGIIERLERNNGMNYYELLNYCEEENIEQLLQMGEIEIVGDNFVQIVKN